MKLKLNKNQDYQRSKYFKQESRLKYKLYSELQKKSLLKISITLKKSYAAPKKDPVKKQIPIQEIIQPLPANVFRETYTKPKEELKQLCFELRKSYLKSEYQRYVGSHKISMYIGKGGFGYVKPKQGPENKLMAIKKSHLLVENRTQLLMKEAKRGKILHFLLQNHAYKEHVATVKDFAIVEDKRKKQPGTNFPLKKIEMAMPYKGVDGVDFTEIILRKFNYKNLTNKNCKHILLLNLKIMKDTVKGVLALQDYGIQHADIKPENIYINTKNDCNTAIGDLGLTVPFNKSKQKAISERKVGTKDYAAPEILNRKVTKVDYEKAAVYSLGKSIIAMVGIGNDKRANYILSHNKDLKNLLKECIDNKPNIRPSFKTLLKRLESIKIII